MREIILSACIVWVEIILGHSALDAVDNKTIVNEALSQKNLCQLCESQPTLRVGYLNKAHGLYWGWGECSRLSFSNTVMQLRLQVQGRTQTPYALSYSQQFQLDKHS